MHDNRAHPFLAQIPLTVSPFVSLPTANTLPYTYKTLPSTLPPTSTGSNGNDKHKFVVSSSGHAAHPDEILESCRELQRHVQRLQENADRILREWESEIRTRDLAEKRRIAPGWLDREERILEPNRTSSSQNDLLTHSGPNDIHTGLSNEAALPQPTKEGEDLDRAFGGLDIRGPEKSQA